MIIEVNLEYFNSVAAWTLLGYGVGILLKFIAALFTLIFVLIGWMPIRDYRNLWSFYWFFLWITTLVVGSYSIALLVVNHA